MKWYEFEAVGTNPNVIFSTVSVYRNFENFPFMSRLSLGNSTSCAKIGEICEKVYEALIPHGFERINTESQKKDGISIFGNESDLLTDYIITVENGSSDTGSTIFYSGDEKNVFVAPCTREHVKISAVYPSLSIERALDDALEAEEIIEAQYPYAFEPSLGYLMKDADRCGCGISLCAMLFLPMCDAYEKTKDLFAFAASYGAKISPCCSSSGLYMLTRTLTRGIGEYEGAEAFCELTGKICALEASLARYMLEKEGDRELLAENCRRAKQISSSAYLISPTEFIKIYRSLLTDATVFSDGTKNDVTDARSLSSLVYLVHICSENETNTDIELCKTLAKRLSTAVSPLAVSRSQGALE